MSEEIKNTGKKAAITEEQLAALMERLEKLEKKTPAEEAAAAEAEAHKKYLDFVQRENKRLEERVPYTLYYDGEKYSGYKSITVNGAKVTVLRGHQVNLKRKHILALEAAEKQEKKYVEYARKKQEEGLQKLKEINR